MTEADRQPLEVRIEGLKKAFGDHVVLDGVDVDIRRGEVVAIVGGSGCGKTVLLSHILNQMQPDAGSVQVADYRQADAPLADLADLDDMEIDDIHTHWGVVFQRNALFSGSVYDNIELWLTEIKDMDEDAIRAIARDVLTAVALPADDDFLETHTDSLSGGMAKRLAVARALSMKPKIIYYDEPTTGLDPTSSAQIHDLIMETHDKGEGDSAKDGGRTTVIITHDKDLLYRLHPRVVMIYEGKIAFDGPFKDFEASNSPITRPYFELMPVLHEREAAGA
ncbi:MAG: ATP-binding cassette domain-containing protein [Rhodospirillales bacterium]|nr:ATP-binding cassette domain-containing protein [Alphaproteobacteria bacterium]MBL6947635.1 ATP-binding cassette domain-containing protein [Rhodospirillales bacterium]